MYAIFDESDFVAYHDSKKVAKRYVNNINKMHNKNLVIRKVKEVPDSFEKLYLVRYADTYVQYGYLDYLRMVADQSLYDNIFAKEILFKILEMDRLNKKDKKIIEKAVDIMDKLITEDETYTPTLKELRGIEADMEPYFYSLDSFDECDWRY